MSMIKINELNKEKKVMIIKLLIVFLYPFFLCLIYCVVRGINIFNLYLPNSHNNDCLFYYKLVEGILSEGIPKGYYGFNESRALVGSFAAWSPALLLPWTLWGILFGWGYSSIFISNVVYFSIALAIFVYLSKMEWKNIFLLFIVLSLYPSLPIHLLSALPETIVSAIMIIFFGLAIKIKLDEYKVRYIVMMLICSIYLTICRPYMAILMFLPCYFLIREKVKWAYFYSVISVSSGLGFYYLCNHFLTCEYLSPLFDLSIVEGLLKGNISEAFWLGVSYAKEMFVGVSQYVEDAFLYGLTAGTQYVVAFMVLIFLTVFCFIKKTREQKSADVIFVTNLVCVFVAIFLLLRKANEGGRHIWAFSVVGCILCLSHKWGKRVIASGILIAGVLGFFLLKGSMVPTDYDVPVMDIELKSNIEYWQTTFSDKEIVVSDEIGYNNTCIWVLTNGGEITNHKELFALPKGMGISCCTEDYVISNIATLKSKYIATTLGGSIDFMCNQCGFEKIGSTEDVIIYQIY